MNRRFSLFSSHIDLAHDYWKRLVQPGDLVVDATCGNGHDTLILANLTLKDLQGSLYALDIQAEALANTQALLSAELSQDKLKRVAFVHGCHSRFPAEIDQKSVKLIVYNLGYLPRGDKAIITKAKTTLESIHSALALICDGGALSITCYPGHEGGSDEKESVLDFASMLHPKEWSCSHHSWLNRQLSPSLLLLQKNFI